MESVTVSVSDIASAIDFETLDVKSTDSESETETFFEISLSASRLTDSLIVFANEVLFEKSSSTSRISPRLTLDSLIVSTDMSSDSSSEIVVSFVL